MDGNKTEEKVENNGYVKRIHREPPSYNPEMKNESEQGDKGEKKERCGLLKTKIYEKAIWKSQF